MSQSILIKKIKAEAEAEVKKIKAEAEAKVKSLTGEVESKIESLRQQTEVELNQEIQHRRLVALSKARQDSNLKRHEVKRKAIDSIMEEVVAEVKKWSSDKYVDWFTYRAKTSAPDLIADKSVKITKISTATDRKREAELILENVGLQFDGSIEENKEIIAGLLIVTDGGVYDLTFDSFFNQKRTELEMSVWTASGIK